MGNVNRENLLFGLGKKNKSLYKSQMSHQAGVYPGFCGITRLEIFLLSPGLETNP